MKDMYTITNFISKETLEEAAEKYENKDQHKRWKLDFIEGAKWQQERSYSEEDMHKLMDEYQDYLFKTNDPVKTFKEWFELIKKILK